MPFFASIDRQDPIINNAYQNTFPYLVSGPHRLATWISALLAENQFGSTTHQRCCCYCCCCGTATHSHHQSQLGLNSAQPYPDDVVAVVDTEQQQPETKPLAHCTLLWVKQDTGDLEPSPYTRSAPCSPCRPGQDTSHEGEHQPRFLLVVERNKDLHLSHDLKVLRPQSPSHMQIPVTHKHIELSHTLSRFW